MQEQNSKDTASVSDELTRYAQRIEEKLSGLSLDGTHNPGAVRSTSVQTIARSIGRPFKFVFDLFPPLSYSENGSGKGLFIDLVRDLLEKRMKITVAYAEHDWDTCQNEVFNGVSDGLITVATPERLAFLDTHVGTLYPFSWVLWTRPDHPRLKEIQAIRNAQDIKKGKFSVVTYPGNGWIKSNLESKGIKVAYKDQEYRYLLEKQADLLVEEPLVAIQKMTLAGVDRKKILRTQVILHTTPFQLLISKKSPWIEILPEFDRNIRDIKSDGTFDTIMARYR